MIIKKYEGCAVDNHHGVYVGKILGMMYNNELLQAGVSAEDIAILQAGPDVSDDYLDVWADILPFTIPGYTFESNESGDILIYSLIDIDTITIGQLNELTQPIPGAKISVYENQFGYADIMQLGDNVLCRVSLANVGIISADCFFEMDLDCFGLDENLQQFIESEIEPKLREEFEEDHIILTLPSYLASYLINCDASGLTNEEQAEVDSFILKADVGPCVGCSEDSWFAHSNDMGRMGADVMEFYFEKLKESTK